jgi:hypothetical protein
MQLDTQRQSCISLVIKINPISFPDLIAILVEHQRRRCDDHRQESENRNSPPISQLLKDHRSKQRRNTAQNTPESRASRDRTSSVLLKTIDIVVLASVENHNLPNTVEIRRSDGSEPMRVQLNRPCEPEQTDGNEDGADVGQGQAVFGLSFAAVAGSEVVVDAVDTRDEEPNCSEEAKTGSEVEEADFLGGEAVVVAVDGLHVGVDAESGTEDEGLVSAHYEDDGLHQDSERAGQGAAELGA